MSPPYFITIVNKSTVLTDAQVEAAIPALQTQITRDFAPIWGVDAMLAFGPVVRSGFWAMYLIDSADVQGALGYHEDPHGNPDGKVFVKTTLDAGLSWTVTLSHELLEALADPTCRRTRTHLPNRYALEVGDPVEDDQYAYKIGGVLVSDFVTPAWFGGKNVGKGYDFMGHCPGPRQLLPGGYALVWSPFRGWRQIVAQNGIVQARKERISRPGTSGRSGRR